MPEISRFRGIIIAMFNEDHPPPHFHARYAEHRAEISIETCEILAGSLPKRIARLVRRWHALHIDELRANWALLESGNEPSRIEPLE
jgi:hypothetical protein